MKNKNIIIKTTVDDLEIARKITYTLLEKRLVCCVQEKEILSTYWWKGNLEYGNEYLLEMKTKKILFEQVKEEIKRLHPYEVPEIIAIDITDGLDTYLDWIEKETKEKDA